MRRKGHFLSDVQGDRMEISEEGVDIAREKVRRAARVGRAVRLYTGG